MTSSMPAAPAADHARAAIQNARSEFDGTEDAVHVELRTALELLDIAYTGFRESYAARVDVRTRARVETRRITSSSTEEARAVSDRMDTFIDKMDRTFEAHVTGLALDAAQCAIEIEPPARRKEDTPALRRDRELQRVRRASAVVRFAANQVAEATIIVASHLPATP